MAVSAAPSAHVMNNAHCLLQSATVAAGPRHIPASRKLEEPTNGE
jgi:hypothetical protein